MRVFKEQALTRSCEQFLARLASDSSAATVSAYTRDLQALTAFTEGLRQREGGATPPLEAELPGGRVEELKTGVGSRP